MRRGLPGQSNSSSLEISKKWKKTLTKKHFLKGCLVNPETI
jgi:hypothetical protein